MKVALISPNELFTQADGGQVQRVCEVADAAFPVAEPLFWVECPDDTKASEVGYLNGVLVPLTYPEEVPMYTMPVSDFGA